MAIRILVISNARCMMLHEGKDNKVNVQTVLHTSLTPVSGPCNQYKNAQVTPKPFNKRPMASDKRRKAGYRPEGMTIMLEEIKINKEILFARFKGAHTNTQKNNVEEEIAKKNYVSQWGQERGKLHLMTSVFPIKRQKQLGLL